MPRTTIYKAFINLLDGKIVWVSVVAVFGRKFSNKFINIVSRYFSLYGSS